jgi:hypothetical protein
LHDSLISHQWRLTCNLGANPATSALLILLLTTTCNSCCLPLLVLSITLPTIQNENEDKEIYIYSHMDSFVTYF